MFFFYESLIIIRIRSIKSFVKKVLFAPNFYTNKKVKHRGIAMININKNM